MKSKKRRAFTLLEMLIVIAIVALTSGVIGISINNALQGQRFRAEVAIITNTLRLAQDLMLALKDDVRVKFSNEADKGIQFWLETDSRLSKNWEREIKRSHKALRAIRTIKFQDEQNGMTQEGNITIQFLSNGSVMSRGVLSFANNKNTWERNAMQNVIFLYGYPHPIASQTETACTFDKNEFFNERLTDLTVQEIMLASQLKDEEKKRGYNH